MSQNLITQKQKQSINIAQKANILIKKEIVQYKKSKTNI